jgi:hypothetical protein
MKKTVSLIAIFILSVSLYGCGSMQTSTNNEIEDIVKAFYQSGYDYVRTETSTVDGVESKIVYTGQVFTNPYKEHVTISSSENVDSTYTEEYFKEDGNQVAITLVSDTGEEINTTGTREYPYGYNQDITYEQDKNTMIDDIEAEVYQGTYSVDIGSAYGLDSDLTATVSQTYYLSKEDRTLLQINTDLTEYNYVMSLATYMSTSEASEEVARENVSNEDTSFVTLEITNLDNPTDFNKE